MSSEPAMKSHRKNQKDEQIGSLKVKDDPEAKKDQKADQKNDQKNEQKDDQKDDQKGKDDKKDEQNDGQKGDQTADSLFDWGDASQLAFDDESQQLF